MMRGVVSITTGLDVKKLIRLSEPGELALRQLPAPGYRAIAVKIHKGRTSLGYPGFTSSLHYLRVSILKRWRVG